MRAGGVGFTVSMMGEFDDGLSKAGQLMRIIAKLVFIFALVYAAKFGVDFLKLKISLFESDAAARAMTGLLVTVLIGYIILLSIPFIPGVEVGIAVLLLLGPSAAPIVYLATVCGLLTAFGVGQYAPLQRLVQFCLDLRMTRIATLLERIHSTPRAQRIHAMQASLPNWLTPILSNYRYVTLALAINMPGNIAIGGGGGIMMAAGLSRLFQTRFVALTVMLSTLPVPLAVWILGTELLR